MLTEDEQQRIGNSIYDALTADERSFFTEALKVTSVDEDDNFGCALGNLDYGFPVGQSVDGDLVEVNERDMRRVCGALAYLRTDPRSDDADWFRLLSGAFGETWDRVEALYAAAGLPETKPDRR